MDITILDTKLQPVAVVDEYRSFIWTDRYSQCGDFELYTLARQDIFYYLQLGYYVVQPGSDHAMIIENIQITSDLEDGSTVRATGRSLESILDRRIVWGQKRLRGNLQNAVSTLLNECIINPSNSKRKIPNFIFKKSSNKYITSLAIDKQYTGDNLYDIITELCYENDIGFRITIDNTNRFVFELYNGVDRSYSQTTAPYVMFSPEFDNIINSNYIESDNDVKNVSLVGGQGEGKNRVYVTIGKSKGLDRREIFVDARGTSTKDEDGNDISAGTYKEMLRQEGIKEMYEHTFIQSFEGKVETGIMYQYGVDFFTGDIVQIENEYGYSAVVRIAEVIFSDDEEGSSIYPTFETLRVISDIEEDEE